MRKDSASSYKVQLENTAFSESISVWVLWHATRFIPVSTFWPTFNVSAKFWIIHSYLDELIFLLWVYFGPS